MELTHGSGRFPVYSVTEDGRGTGQRFRGIHSAIRRVLVCDEGLGRETPVADIWDVDSACLAGQEDAVHPWVGCRETGAGLTAARYARMGLFVAGAGGTRRLAPVDIGLSLSTCLRLEMTARSRRAEIVGYREGDAADAATCRAEARWLLAELAAAGLEPWRSEVPVRSNVLGFATAIDMLAIDDAGRIVVVEFKRCTGEAHCCHRGKKGRPRFRAPLHHVHDTPMTRACVQAWLAMLVLGLDYGVPFSRLSWAAVVCRGTGIPCEVRRPTEPVDALPTSGPDLDAVLAAFGSATVVAGVTATAR